MDDLEETIVPQSDTQFHNWYNYEKRTINIFPLYSYYKSEYYLSEMVTLRGNFIILYGKLNVLYLYDAINFLDLDIYINEIIYIKIIKCIYGILLWTYCKRYTKNFTFLNLKKISINIFQFTYKLKNICLSSYKTKTPYNK